MSRISYIKKSIDMINHGIFRYLLFLNFSIFFSIFFYFFYIYILFSISLFPPFYIFSVIPSVFYLLSLFSLDYSSLPRFSFPVSRSSH